MTEENHVSSQQGTQVLFRPTAMRCVASVNEIRESTAISRCLRTFANVTDNFSAFALYQIVVHKIPRRPFAIPYLWYLYQPCSLHNLKPSGQHFLNVLGALAAVPGYSDPNLDLISSHYGTPDW